MATLWVTEYAYVSVGHGAGAPMPMEPPEADATVTYTTATQSNAFTAKTKFVRLMASANCHVAFGANPTATAAKQRLTAGVEY